MTEEERRLRQQRYNRKRYIVNGAAMREANRRRKHDNPARWLYWIATARAKKNGLEFTIDLEDIVVPLHCPITGIELKANDGKLSDSSPTLDRVKTNQGYIKGNVRVISHRANRCKSDLSPEEIKGLYEYVFGLR